VCSRLASLRHGELQARASGIASIIDEWSPLLHQRVGELLDGTYEQVASWGGMREGEVVIGEITAVVPDAVRDEALAMVAAHYRRSYHPCTARSRKQERLRVPSRKGEVANRSATW